MTRLIPLLAAMALTACLPTTTNTTDTAITAFVDACMSNAPDFGAAPRTFAARDVQVFGTTVMSESAFAAPIFAMTGPMTDPAKGSVCNLTIKGNADEAAASAVLTYLQSDAFALRGTLQQDVRIDTQGSMASVMGSYPTPSGSFEVFISKGQRLPGLGRVTLLGTLVRK